MHLLILLHNGLNEIALKKITLGPIIGPVKVNTDYTGTFIFDVEGSTSKLMDASFIGLPAISDYLFSKN